MKRTTLKNAAFFALKTLIFTVVLSISLLYFFPVTYARNFAYSPHGDSAVHNRWVDSVFATMTPDERVGQLFMVEVSSKWGAADKLYKNVEQYVTDYHIGGVLFFYGGPNRQAAITNKLQSISKVPLMIAQDAEWGLGMRLDSTISYPRQLTLGAVEDDEIVYQTGLEIARQCRRLGVNIDFAPCVDIYDNPGNSVIVNRSFGSDKQEVARKSLAIMSGMQDGGILTTAKHFPGHGNTVTDSHYDLPIIKGDKQRIDTFELYPFKYLINNGVKGIMVGHLFVEAYDDSIAQTPSSISENIISKLLKKNLGFQGLVFTDALAMQGVSRNYPSGELEIRAFKAGVDVFLQPKDFVAAYNGIIAARDSGYISQKEIDIRCKKILLAKKQLGLDNFQPVSTENLYQDLNNDYAQNLQSQIVKNSITLIKNRDNLLPLKDLSSKRIAAVSIGKTAEETEFEISLRRFTNLDVFTIEKEAEPASFTTLSDTLKTYDLVIIGFHNCNAYPPRFGFTANSINFAETLAKTTPVVLGIFTNPMGFTKFNPKNDNFAAILVAYDDTPLARRIAGEMVFGELPFKGRLPVRINAKYPHGTGFKTEGFKVY